MINALEIVSKQDLSGIAGEYVECERCRFVENNIARAISCADKIHNIDSLLMALERHKGREQVMWDRLKATPKEQLDKFVNLHEGIEGVWQHPILNELTSMKDRLKAAVAAQDSQGGHQSRGAVEPPKG